MGWYLLSCKSGQEERLIRFCRGRLPGEILEDAFQFSYERMKKYLGAWHVDTYPMFPGYVFLQSSRPERLSEELGRCRGQADMLPEQGRRPLPVARKEEHLLRMLCGERRHMGLSRGTVKNGRLCVAEGPLAGREDLIERLDLHRRVAVLRLSPAQGGRNVWAGIDILPGGDIS